MADLTEYDRANPYGVFWTYPVRIIICLGNIALQPVISAVVVIAGVFFASFGLWTCSDWIGRGVAEVLIGFSTSIFLPLFLVLRVFNLGCFENSLVEWFENEQNTDQVEEEFTQPGPSSLSEPIQAILQLNRQSIRETMPVEK